jgi:hypothetical protein
MATYDAAQLQRVFSNNRPPFLRVVMFGQSERGLTYEVMHADSHGCQRMNIEIFGRLARYSSHVEGH